VVKIKDRRKFWVFCGALVLVVFLGGLVYFYRNSSVIENIGKTFGKIFGNRDTQNS